MEKRAVSSEGADDSSSAEFMLAQHTEAELADACIATVEVAALADASDEVVG